MNGGAQKRLERARRELDAARHLARGGYSAQAVSRAYFAAFYAAEAGLLLLGETRSKHSGVISLFAQRLAKPGEIDQEVGRLLRSLFDRRNEADYAAPAVPPAEAEAAIADADRVVTAIEAWMRRRAG